MFVLACGHLDLNIKLRTFLSVPDRDCYMIKHKLSHGAIYSLLLLLLQHDVPVPPCAGPRCALDTPHWHCGALQLPVWGNCMSMGGTRGDCWEGVWGWDP